MSEREKLATYAHEAWSGWMRHLFSKCAASEVLGALTIPAWAVERARRQMETPYELLTEDEKNSDRAEADRMLVIVGAELDKAHEHLLVVAKTRVLYQEERDEAREQLDLLRHEVAACDPVYDGECALCGKIGLDRFSAGPDRHADGCPWRLAKAALAKEEKP